MVVFTAVLRRDPAVPLDSFGGPVPLKPKGYECKVAFPEATTLPVQADVRIAGVSVGKVVKLSLDKGGARTIATIDSRKRTRRSPRTQGDPAPEDAAGGDLRGALDG